MEQLRVKTPDIYDAKTGEKLSLAEAEIPQAIASGRAAFLKGENIQVVSPSGEIGTIPAENASVAFAKGYRPQTASEIQDEADKETYGTGTDTAVKAGLAGAARMASLGLSDQALVRSGLVKPETLEGLKKYRPGYTTAGEIAGIGGMLLAPETAIPKLLNPVKAVSSAGRAVTKAATPLAEKTAAMLINPETAQVASKMASQALAVGAGSAVEGVAYGLGQSISENALGDPDAFGEKLVSNVGYSALFAGGIGGLIGAASAPFATKAGEKAAVELSERAAREIPSVAEARAAAADNFESSIEKSMLPEAEKSKIISGISKLKDNVGEIDAAGKNLGVEVFPGQRTASDFTRNRYGMTTQSPSAFGVAEQQKIAGAVKKVSQEVESSMGSASAMSEAELGNAVKKGMVETIQSDLDPITDLYENQIKPYHEAVPLSDKGAKQIGRNVLRLKELVTAEGKPLSEGSPQWRFAKQVSEELPNLKTVDDLKRYRTLIRQQAAGDPALKFTLGQIQEKLARFEERSILRFANDTIQTPEGRQKVLEVVKLRKEANAKYAALRDKMSDLGDIIGKRKIYGPRDLIDHIEDGINPEKLAQKLTKLAQNNSEGLAFVKENFPQQFELVKAQIKSEIRAAAIKDGALDVNKALREVEKLSPEAKAMLFSKKEIQVLKDAKTWHDAWGAKWGPSGTPKGMMDIDFFGSPIKATGMTVRDLVGLKFAHAVAGAESKAGHVSALAALERSINEQGAKIVKASKAVFSASAASVIPVAVTVSQIDRRKKFEKTQEQVTELSNNPGKLIDTLDMHTRDLYGIAPNITGSVHQTAIRATQFLHSKLPVPPPQKLFSPKWQPSHSEVEKFNRYYRVVESPLSVLHDLKTASLTPESVETIQAVYPKLYDDMKLAVMDQLSSHLTKKDASLPYRHKMALSLFLGQDLDQSLTPESIHTNQTVIAATGMQQNQGQPGNPNPQAKSITIASRTLLPSQQASERGQA